MTSQLPDLVHLRSVLSRECVAALRERAQASLHGIHRDYFAEKAFDAFAREHLGHESLVMKIAAYRFATAEVLCGLKASIAESARRVYGCNELLLHPIFYLRFSFPGIHYSTKHAAAFLDSQPHFDRSYGVDAFSFWVALDDIDAESGGLCSFTGRDIHEHFAGGERNRYSYDAYLEVAGDVDPMLRAGTVAPAIPAGDVLTFGAGVLHGATKPRTRTRISFDFRLVSADALRDAPDATRRVFNAVNEDVGRCNACNLIMTGDYRGAGQILLETPCAAHDGDRLAVARALMLRPPDPEITRPGARMNWRKEYAWAAGDGTA